MASSGEKSLAVGHIFGFQIDPKRRREKIIKKGKIMVAFFEKVC